MWNFLRQINGFSLFSEDELKDLKPLRKSATTPRICILGGGFGGLYTALYLRRFHWLNSSNCQITLVDQKNHFLFTPLLYELVTGELQQWEIAPSYKKLLSGTKIHFCQAIIECVDLETRLVKFQGAGYLAYDYLVLAVGVEACLNRVPGAASYALPFRTLADAERLKEQLRILEFSNRRCLRLIIVGGGPSGIELACKLAERFPRRGQVALIEMGKEILQSFSPYIRAAANRALKAFGVSVYY